VVDLWRWPVRSSSVSLWSCSPIQRPHTGWAVFDTKTRWSVQNHCGNQCCSIYHSAFLRDWPVICLLRKRGGFWRRMEVERCNYFWACRRYSCCISCVVQCGFEIWGGVLLLVLFFALGQSHLTKSLFNHTGYFNIIMNLISKNGPLTS